MKRLSFSYKNYYKCKTVKTGKCHLSVPMYFASILMFIKTLDNRIIDILFCFLWSSAIYRMTCENVETTVFFYPSIYHAYIHPSSSFNLLFCHTKTTQTNWVIVLNAVTTSHLTAALFPKVRLCYRQRRRQTRKRSRRTAVNPDPWWRFWGVKTRNGGAETPAGRENAEWGADFEKNLRIKGRKRNNKRSVDLWFLI